MIHTRELVRKLGLAKSGASWRGGCPACDYARAFALRDSKGHALAYCANGCTQEALADALRRVSGGEWKQPGAEPDRLDEAARRQRATASALRVWAGCNAAQHSLADIYLQKRGLAGLAVSPALRFRSDCRHPEGGACPALVALVVSPVGEPVAIHRTYLATGGQKAALTPVKASKGLVWGGAIRLDPEAAEITVGEGIESSASAGRLLGLPAWAAVSAGNLARALVLPPAVRRVVIAADADKAGAEAAEAAAARWRAEGRAVRIARPDCFGCDFNDVLRAMEAAHAA